ncbi:MAG: hypothetical protein Q7S09_05060 [bacterium]|nr:hypothetical protein [bacterium]
MKNLFTIHVETRVGAAIILCCAVLVFSLVMRAISNFSSFLILLEADTPIAKTVVRAEHDRINQWLQEQGLNAHGDAPDTVYENGSPLFDEGEDKPIDRYAYLVRKFPNKPWHIR